MFNPALTTCASERMKTQRFSYVAGFAARERMREAKPVKARKSGVQPLFRYAETSFRASFLLSAQVRAALRPVKKISATAMVGVKRSRREQRTEAGSAHLSAGVKGNENMRTKAVEAAVSVSHAPDHLDGVVDAPGEAIESGKVKNPKRFVRGPS